MLKEERDYSRFAWEDLGDVDAGRPNLGPQVQVLVYRLMQYTLRDVLITELGVDRADDMIVKAGRVAGLHFSFHMPGLHEEAVSGFSYALMTGADSGTGRPIAGPPFLNSPFSDPGTGIEIAVNFPLPAESGPGSSANMTGS